MMQIWDVREGRLLFAVHGHAGAVAHAAFSPDAEQTLFASAGKQDQLVKVWGSNLGCYAKQPPILVARSPEQSQPQPRRPAPPLQRVLHYHSQEELLPALPRRVPRPAYQRPTPLTPPAAHDAAPEEGLWQHQQQQETQQYWGEQGGGGGGDDAPTAAQTTKGLTGRGGSGDGGTQQQRWQSLTLRRTRQRQLQEAGLDVEEGEDENGWATTMRKGGGAAVAAGAAPILVAPSAPPQEEEEEDDEEVPRQHRPPRPDSAGVAAARETTSEARLQQTLQAMNQTMQLMAERLALVEDRLAGGAQISPAPTVQLPVSMGGGTGWLSTETGGGREGMPE